MLFSNEEALALILSAIEAAGFRPGKIDGLGGEFTQKAADRYSAANGLQPGALLDVAGIPNSYREYTVTDEDIRAAAARLQPSSRAIVELIPGAAQ